MSMSETSPSAKKTRLSTNFDVELSAHHLSSISGPILQRRYENNRNDSSFIDPKVALDYGGRGEQMGPSTNLELPLRDIVPFTSASSLVTISAVGI